MKRHLLNSNIFLIVVRWWLTFVLCFIPFKFYVVKNIELWNSALSKGLGQIDLITTILLFPVALIELYNNRRGLKWLHIILLVSLSILSILGLVSGIINGNSLLITCNGIFEYIKYLLVIFIFSAFFKKYDEFNKIYNFLLIITLFLATAAVIQELWAGVYRYILDRDINDKGIYLFQYLMSDEVRASFWRFGFYRVSPFMNSPIIFGLYCLFFLTIYLFFEKKIKLPVVFLIMIGSFLSFSRIVYLCMALLFILQFIKGRKWLLILAIPFLVISFFLSSMDDLNIWKFKDNISEANNSNSSGYYEDSEGSYRLYARDKAIEIWKDHPIWGVGPGMFGGVVSVKYQSPVYEEYNFSSNNQYLKRIWGIDQFWSQVIAEIGIVGICAFAVIFFSIITICFLLKKEAISHELRGLYTGLILLTIFIIIYAFGIQFNIAAVLFTYSAIAGMALGCANFTDKAQ